MFWCGPTDRLVGTKMLSWIRFITLIWMVGRFVLQSVEFEKLSYLARLWSGVGFSVSGSLFWSSWEVQVFFWKKLYLQLEIQITSIMFTKGNQIHIQIIITFIMGYTNLHIFHSGEKLGIHLLSVSEFIDNMSIVHM